MYNKPNIFKQSSSVKKKSCSTEKKTNIFLNSTKKFNASNAFKNSQKIPNKPQNIFTKYQKNNKTNQMNQANKKEFDIKKEEFPEFPSVGSIDITIHKKDYAKISTASKRCSKQWRSSFISKLFTTC